MKNLLLSKMEKNKKITIDTPGLFPKSKINLESGIEVQCSNVVMMSVLTLKISILSGDNDMLIKLLIKITFMS